MKKNRNLTQERNCQIIRSGPAFPQAKMNGDDLTLDLSTLGPNEKIQILVEVVEPIPEDTVSIYFDSVTSGEEAAVELVQDGTTYYVVYKDPKDFPNWVYTVNDRINHYRAGGYTGCDSSLDTVVTFVNSPSPLLPPPDFPDAPYGFLDTKTILQDNGTSVSVTYPNMNPHDQVTLTWNAYAWNSATPIGPPYIETKTVQDQNTPVTFTVPKENILPAGNLGTGKASYSVLFAHGGGTSSLTGAVEISSDNYDKLLLNVTNGAVFANQLPSLQPCSWGSLYGGCGQSVIVTVPKDVTIIDDQGISQGNSWTTIIPGKDNSTVNFTIFTNTNKEPTVIAYSDQIRGEPPHATINFYDQLTSTNGGLLEYNFTSGAPADDTTPCSLYVKVNRPWATKLRVILATLTGKIQSPSSTDGSPDYPLPADGKMVFSIVNTKPETFWIQMIGMDDHGVNGSPVKFQMSFVDFPQIT